MTTSNFHMTRADMRRRPFAFLCSPLLALAVLSGCASVAPDSAVPDLAQRHGSGASISPAAEAAGARLGVPPRAWWQDLGDARLDELVRQAMDRNAERQGRTGLGCVKRVPWPARPVAKACPRAA